MENNQIVMLYGHTDKNKEDLYSRKAEIWNEMAKEIILPNNAKIVSLLENNMRLMNQNDIEIFVKFKIHANGFEDNRNVLQKRTEYLQFPQEIYNILK